MISTRISSTIRRSSQPYAKQAPGASRFTYSSRPTRMMPRGPSPPNGRRCTVRWAPARFAQPYAFDHAKYVVVNVSTPQVTAIIGTSDYTYSAFDGANLEAAAVVTGAPAQAAAQVFQAD